MPEDHVECLIISLDSVSDPVEIRTVPDVGLIDFDEEVMIFEIAKPVDPPDLDLFTEFTIV